MNVHFFITYLEFKINILIITNEKKMYVPIPKFLQINQNVLK